MDVKDGYICKIGWWYEEKKFSNFIEILIEKCDDI